MPLFMDRHDIPGATAKDSAEAHMADLAVANKHGVEFFSYWFDPDHGSVFCFARSPSRDEIVAAHSEAHGMLPNEIIAVSEDSVLKFLGTVRDPVDHTDVTSAFRTIVFTDLEGSTALTEEVGLSEYMVLLTEHDLIVRRALVAVQGREVKHTGDGFLASFDDVADALGFCLTVQQGFRARAESGAQPELRVKIGVTAGEPVDHNDDIFGTPVNLAARLCDAATGGQIFVADSIPELVSDDDFDFAEVGARSMKGFPDPVPVFELLGA
jgi:class 3 adenylate cyclase